MSQETNNILIEKLQTHFNTKIQGLFDKAYNMTVGNISFLLIKNLFPLYSQKNPQMPQQHFQKYITDLYTPQINNKDDSFFTGEKNPNVEKLGQDQYIKEQQFDIMQIIQQIGDIWGNLNDEQKEDIWEEIIKVNVLSQRIQRLLI